MYSLKDISLIIPTYNRSEDLFITLNSFKKNIPKLCEVIIIDQSTDSKTKELIAQFKNKKIRYIHSNIPSLTVARNLGVTKSSSKSQIILFTDDDVSLGSRYFEEIIKVFNDNYSAKGVGGYYLSKETKQTRTEKFLRQFFLIEHKEKDNAQVLSSYGAVYPSELTRTINSQWIPGFNMAFKKEVFTSQRFDENLSKYSLAEDFDFTYRIGKEYPKSLFITPKAKLLHRASIVERYPTQKIAYMNQIHHIYLNFKNFNSTFKEKTIFIWNILGILTLRFLLLIFTMRKSNLLKFKFFIESLVYCLNNLSKIRSGNLNY